MAKIYHMKSDSEKKTYHFDASVWSLAANSVHACHTFPVMQLPMWTVYLQSVHRNIYECDREKKKKQTMENSFVFNVSLTIDKPLCARRHSFHGVLVCQQCEFHFTLFARHHFVSHLKKAKTKSDKICYERAQSNVEDKKLSSFSSFLLRISLTLNWNTTTTKIFSV